MKQFMALEFLSMQPPGQHTFAEEIGAHLRSGAARASARGFAATGSGVARFLIENGWATRTLVRRELYAYQITDAGRVAHAEAA